MLKLSIPVVIAALLSVQAAEAAQYNQPRHLKVGSQAKVSRVIAKSKTLTAVAREDNSKTPG
jgi:hypothetical protein